MSDQKESCAGPSIHPASGCVTGNDLTSMLLLWMLLPVLRRHHNNAFIRWPDPSEVVTANGAQIALEMLLFVLQHGRPQ